MLYHKLLYKPFDWKPQEFHLKCFWRWLVLPAVNRCLDVCPTGTGLMHIAERRTRSDKTQLIKIPQSSDDDDDDNLYVHIHTWLA